LEKKRGFGSGGFWDILSISVVVVGSRRHSGEKVGEGGAARGIYKQSINLLSI
jgi:hypothetical protein